MAYRSLADHTGGNKICRNDDITRSRRMMLRSRSTPVKTTLQSTPRGRTYSKRTVKDCPSGYTVASHPMVSAILPQKHLRNLHRAEEVLDRGG